MLLSPSRKFIFIHIQKTGGSSVENALSQTTADAIRRFEDLPACRDPLKNRHIFASDLKSYLGDTAWNSYFKFAFVRNPWARLVSWYNMCVERPTNPFMWFVKTHAATFEDFLDLTDGRARKTIFNQVDYVADDTGQFLLDFIGKMETLSENFSQVCERLNVNVPLPHLNRGPNTDYRTWYTGRTKMLVEKRFSRDIETFGYTFE